MQDLTLFNKDSAKELINKNSSFVSITTLEIAELCGKEHKNVLRDCDEQLPKIVGLGGMPKFEHTYTHPQNRQTYRMYRLPKREALILVSGYIVELRAKIIDRLEYLENELRNQGQYKLPQTYKTPYGSKVSLKTLVTGKEQIYFTEKLRNRI